ncbi:MAG: hypothetical protein R3262_03840 [Xanthomarina gelatinilytica]|nr:hypothetical protein [Xanthomarina gelatinilytica]
MESHSTIIGIVIALVIIIPLILIQTSQKRQKKNSRKGFMEEASKHHLQVKTPDFWGTYYAMAIDETANKLIYSKIIDAEHQVTLVDLSLVDSCDIVRTQRTHKNKTTSKIETDRIDLVITYKSKNKEVLEFYNVDVNFEMNNEIVLLDKWNAIIKSKIFKKAQAA